MRKPREMLSTESMVSGENLYYDDDIAPVKELVDREIPERN